MRKSSYRIIEKSQLRKEYIENKKSSEVIAKEYNTSPRTIIRLMKEFKINLRSPKERQKLIIEIYGPAKLGKKTSEETKRKLSKLVTGRKVSEETKAKISRTQKNIKHNKEWNKKVSLALKGRKKSPEHLMKLRKVWGEKKGKTFEELYGKEKAKKIKEKLSKKFSGKNNPMYGKTHTKEVRKIISNAAIGRVSPLKGIPLSEETKHKIRLKHLGKHHSPKTGFKKGHKTWIKGVGHSEETKIKLSKIHKGKTISKETKKKMSLAHKGKKMGDKNPAWNGGTSFGEYDLNFGKTFRRHIRERDNDSCVICGSNNRLAVHHVDYDKKNSIKENSISLCNSCHSKTNFNRNHWIKFFQSMLSERYDYKYSELNEPIINIDKLFTI